jgi:CRISPR/Cas system CMR subunit Cmr4 (Cas7 group RAMP superfamily)
MRLPQGEHLLRLEVLTPANLGSAAGEAGLDRPTQKDAQSGLPFLPDSALKGVLAGFFGKTPLGEDDSPDDARERIFGSPDRTDAPGSPANLVLGNGELLSFPLPAPDGTVVQVVPALAAGRVLRLDPAAGEVHRDALSLLALLEGKPEPRAFAWPDLPDLPGSNGLAPLTDATARRGAAPLLAHLQRYLRGPLPEGDSLAVVSSATARHLWWLAAERRALTALQAGEKTAASGSLRTIELIPHGTLFFSRVSCLEEISRALPERFQVGAWESLGLGWVEMSRVEAAGGGEETAAPGGFRSGPRLPKETDVMIAMHHAVRRLRDEPEGLQGAVKAAITNFGPRAQFSGIEAALAFELAKAKPVKSEPKTDAKAHRWLLSTLLGAGGEEPFDGGALTSWLREAPFETGEPAARRPLLLTRWHWLRRFAEFGLDVAPAEEVL